MHQHVLCLPQVASPECVSLPVVPPLVMPLQSVEDAVPLVGCHEENLALVEARRDLEESFHRALHGEAEYLALLPAYHLEEQPLRWLRVPAGCHLLDHSQVVLRAVVAHRRVASTCVARGALPPLAAAARVRARAGVCRRVRHRWSPHALCLPCGAGRGHGVGAWGTRRRRRRLWRRGGP